jgi:Holliday junction resolvasome RuvABC endonuclease subunit
MSFSKVLVPKLDEIEMRFNLTGIAMETPPFIQRQIKTSALLWAVGSIIFTWGHMQGKRRKHCSPITLKRGVSKALGLTWNRKFIPKKAQVKEVVQRIFGEAPRTSHENDAVLAAILLYSEII